LKKRKKGLEREVECMLRAKMESNLYTATGETLSPLWWEYSPQLEENCSDSKNTENI